MKKTLLISFILILLSTKSFSAGSGSGSGEVKSNYDKAVSFIKSAKKYEKKGKLKKQKKIMKRL